MIWAQDRRTIEAWPANGVKESTLKQKLPTMKVRCIVKHSETKKPGTMPGLFIKGKPLCMLHRWTDKRRTVTPRSSETMTL